VSGVIVSEWLDFTQECMSWVYVVAGACVLWLHVFKVQNVCVVNRYLAVYTHTHVCVYTYMTCSMYVKLHVCMYHRIYL